MPALNEALSANRPWLTSYRAAEALGQIGDSITLLASKDALSGLRDGTLALYPGQFVFSIIEP